MGDDDHILVKKCIQGQSGAFDRLYDRYARKVFSLLRRLTANDAEAEDLTQETFIAAFRSLGSWRQDGRFGSWLYGIASHIYANRNRRRGTKEAEPLDEQVFARDDTDPLTWMARYETTKTIEEAVATLPALCLEAFVLVKMEGMSYREAAERLQVPVGTVQSRLWRATQELKRVLLAGDPSMGQSHSNRMGNPTRKNAEDIHFRVDGSARSRRIGRRPAQIENPEPQLPIKIGIVFSEEVTGNVIESNHYTGLLMSAIQNEAFKSGIDISVNVMAGDDYLKLAREKKVEGLLINAPGWNRDNMLRDLDVNGIPLVVLGGTVAYGDACCVDSDNRAAAQDAIQYMAKLGHRKFGIIAAPFTTSNWLDRWLGFQDGVHSTGLELDPLNVVSGVGLTREITDTDRAVLQRMMRPKSRPSAILATDYHFALKVMRIAQEEKIVIPDELSVIGFDDPSSAALLHPSLTTLRQPLELMGRRALNLLVDIIRNGRPASAIREIHPLDMIIRESCAAPLGSCITHSVNRPNRSDQMNRFG